QHTFQVLTKRPERMMTWTRANFRSVDSRKAEKSTLSPHIWLGVSVENQEYLSRVDYLQKTPAQVRFLSLEPLLGPLHLSATQLAGVHWVIVGGESGPRARRMNPKWVQDIQKQCEKCQVSFFFKQWGAHDGSGRRVGKKAAG